MVAKNAKNAPASLFFHGPRSNNAPKCHCLFVWFICLLLGVGDFAPGAFTDVSTDVDDEGFVCHVDFAFVRLPIF